MWESLKHLDHRDAVAIDLVSEGPGPWPEMAGLDVRLMWLVDLIGELTDLHGCGLGSDLSKPIIPLTWRELVVYGPIVLCAHVLNNGNDTYRHGPRLRDEILELKAADQEGW
jgi:hypothetical protein